MKWGQALLPVMARQKAIHASLGYRTGSREALIRRVLVATDFSPSSNRAIDRAIALTNQCNAGLAIFHVIDVNTHMECGRAADLMKQLWDAASAQMGQLAASLSGQVNAQILIEEGLPWEAISRKSRDFDLAILGKPRPPSLRRPFSRQTVRRVLEEAACPVLVI
jgi:nucleotide-binding universal stress UspA family protein